MLAQIRQNSNKMHSYDLTYTWNNKKDQMKPQPMKQNQAHTEDWELLPEVEEGHEGNGWRELRGTNSRL